MDIDDTIMFGASHVNNKRTNSLVYGFCRQIFAEFPSDNVYYTMQFGLINICIRFYKYWINCKVGDRVKVETECLNNGANGVIKFIGCTDFENEKLAGIELDEWSPNGHNGKVDGGTYFRAAPGCGMFAPITAILNLVNNDQISNSADDNTSNNSDNNFKIGAHVELICGKTGFIRYIGAVGNDDVLVGIELDSWWYNGHDGKGHFSCPIGMGYFAKPSDIIGVVDASEKSVKHDIISTQKMPEVAIIGDVHFDRREMLGIVLDRWSPNAHNGSIDGKSYFVAPEGRGILVPLSAVQTVDFERYN